MLDVFKDVLTDMTDKDIENRIEAINKELLILSELTDERHELNIELLMRKYQCKAGDKISYEGKQGVIAEVKFQDSTFLKYYPIKKDGAVGTKLLYIYYPDKMTKC